MNGNNSTPPKGSAPDLAKFAERVGTLAFGVTKELWLGVRYDLIPWNICMAGGVACCIAYLSGQDRAVFEWLSIGKLYPTRPRWVIAYLGCVLTSSFWLWAFRRWATKQKRSRELERVFCEAGLRSSQGRVPSLIFDKEADEFTKILRVTMAGGTADKFKKAKDGIESNLGIYIDDFRENRRRGTVDIIYSKKEMPRTVNLKNVSALPPCKFRMERAFAGILPDAPCLLPIIRVIPITAAQEMGGYRA